MEDDVGEADEAAVFVFGDETEHGLGGIVEA